MLDRRKCNNVPGGEIYIYVPLPSGNFPDLTPPSIVERLGLHAPCDSCHDIVVNYKRRVRWHSTRENRPSSPWKYPRYEPCASKFFLKDIDFVLPRSGAISACSDTLENSIVVLRT